jgi:hypothetical protein
VVPERHFVFHLVHEERWNHKVWLDLGERFDNLLTRSVVSANTASASPNAKTIEQILKHPLGFKLALKRFSGAHSEKFLKSILTKRSARNISEIDAWRLSYRKR